MPRATRRLHALAAIVLAASLVRVAPDANAQGAWPRQPIKLVLTTPPGGAVDVLGRIMAAELTKTLGQPVVVENRGGANGNLAGDLVAKSAPDGYTLLQTSGGMLTTNPHLYASMPFDPLKDLVPITQVGLNPLWLVVKPALPPKTLKEFIDYLKANPDKVTYGSAGSGSALHIAQEMFGRATGTSAVHVPYKGAGPALNDVVAGQIDFVWDPGPSLQHVKAGKVRVIAVGAPRRLSAAPDVPTVAELGVPGYDSSSAHALLAPAGTPREIVDRINRDAVKILQQAEVRDRFRALGIDPIGNGVDEAAANIRSEYERLGKLVREAKIRLD